MKARIITDSANDLPEELLDKYNIPFASLTIAFDDETTLRDGKDLSRDEFYFRLVEAKQLPKTSQPSPQAFYEIIEETLAQNLEAVVITLSSGLSGTFGSAQMAKKMFSEEEQQKIHIMDTLAASIGQGILVLEAARMAEKDMSGQEIVEGIQSMRQKMDSVFTIDTFEYLLKGGRITKMQAVLGTMLDIKPLLEVTSEGKLKVCEKVRGKKKSFARMLEIIDQRGKDLGSQTIGIVHARAPEDAKILVSKIVEKFEPREIIVGEMSATIATHTGPGCLGVFFYGG